MTSLAPTCADVPALTPHADARASCACMRASPPQRPRKYISTRQYSTSRNDNTTMHCAPTSHAARTRARECGNTPQRAHERAHERGNTQRRASDRAIVPTKTYSEVHHYPNTCTRANVVQTCRRANIQTGTHGHAHSAHKYRRPQRHASHRASLSTHKNAKRPQSRTRTHKQPRDIATLHNNHATSLHRPVVISHHRTAALWRACRDTMSRADIDESLCVHRTHMNTVCAACIVFMCVRACVRAYACMCISYQYTYA